MFSPSAPAFRKHKMSADKILPQSLQHLLVIYVISNRVCIMQAKKGKGGKERQFSTTSAFVLNLQPEMLRKSLVSNMAIQSDNINSI